MIDIDPGTDEKNAANCETWKHIHEVELLLGKVISELHDRALNHDRSKLHSPEVECFAVYTPKLAGMRYGSPEYKECLRKMAPTLAHHYRNNSHHPEHYVDGIVGMSLIDLLEMLCDWKAASMRTDKGSLIESLRINRERFKMSDQLFAILVNTAEDLFGDGTDKERRRK